MPVYTYLLNVAYYLSKCTKVELNSIVLKPLMHYTKYHASNVRLCLIK